jgi:hypothetical protein
MGDLNELACMARLIFARHYHKHDVQYKAFGLILRSSLQHAYYIVPLQQYMDSGVNKIYSFVTFML